MALTRRERLDNLVNDETQILVDAIKDYVRAVVDAHPQEDRNAQIIEAEDQLFAVIKGTLMTLRVISQQV